jgi:hypothetical protein
MRTGSRWHNQLNATDDDTTSWLPHDPPALSDYLPEHSPEVGAFAPTSGIYSPPQVLTLYLTEAGQSTAINVADINQGQLGDCFLLSSIGEQALFHPNAISRMIHDNGNGTETVTLYVDRNGRLPNFNSTGFRTTTVTVDNTFSRRSVNNGYSQDTLGNQKEIWVQVLEKSVAMLNGGYDAIANGGYPVLAMEELTGQTATYVAPAQMTLAVLQKHVAAGDLMTFDTSSRGGLPYGLVSNHAYMFSNLIGSGSATSIQLLNPWGYNQPAAIPFARLATSGVINIDIGHAA